MSSKQSKSMGVPLSLLEPSAAHFNLPFIKGMDGKPKTGYNFCVFTCSDGNDIQAVYDWGRHVRGFYPYLISQAKGCYIVAAYADPDQKTNKSQVMEGQEFLSETEARHAIQKIMSTNQNSLVVGDWLDTAIIMLYDQGFKLSKRVDKERL